MDLCIKGSGSMERNMGGEFLNGEVAKYTKALFKMDKCMAKENSTSLGQKVNTQASSKMVLKQMELYKLNMEGTQENSNMEKCTIKMVDLLGLIIRFILVDFSMDNFMDQGN